MKPFRSLRWIALLEAAKGAVILLAGFGLLGLMHADLQHAAEELVRHFHLNPASRCPRIFLDAAARVNNFNLWLLAAAALAYATLRFVEAFGLWHQRRWAEWLGALSGGIYIPIEVYELLNSVSWAKAAILLVNTVCVLYLVQALRSDHEPAHMPEP
jgi:uncharacterized membrane protein (DUF2068 family)